MRGGSRLAPYTCARCRYRQLQRCGFCNSPKAFSHAATTLQAPEEQASGAAKDSDQSKGVGEAPEDAGAMSRRLADLMERNLEDGSRSARKVVEEAGFSEELKQRLEARIADSQFKSDNPSAFAQMNMPTSAGRGTREVATAQPWSGTEQFEDAALRMLDDAHKPLRIRGPPKIPQPGTVDMRMKKAVRQSQGQRLANVRDRTSIYALSQDPTMTEKEREQMRKQLKERFTPAARPMPGTLQGLAGLANERIEDAIARGQFKNIARGKGKNIERDHNASSPFLDTTEYFMNKIIQKQEIVPPWIEKQQELVKAAAVFRSRLRADWKRHAARVIASKGGPLESQIRRAEAYAAAEAAINPKAPKTEAISTITHEGKIAQVTVTDFPPAPNSPGVSQITVTESISASPPTSPDPELTPSISPGPDSTSPLHPASPSTPPPREPFRDPSWEALEAPYHTLSITHLNNLTRSYNLQAPDLAKKPYLSLQRELRSCFADVAPQLADAIRERARTPEKIRVEKVGHKVGGVMERFGGEKARVYDSTKPNYGFREFWRELWGRKEEERGLG